MFQDIKKARKLTMPEPETAQRQATLSRDKKPGERERISRSLGVHLRLCFSRGSNEDLPLLQSTTCVRDSHHHHQQRSIGVKISRWRGKTRNLGSGRSRKNKATSLSPAGTNLGRRSDRFKSNQSRRYIYEN